MNADFPPLSLVTPQKFNRRKAPRPRDFPLSPEQLEHRRLIANSLLEQIKPLSEQLLSLSETERRAVFYKLEHEGATPTSGTGLKPIVEPTENITLVVPREDNLTRLIEKIVEFGEGELRDGKPKNAQLALNLQAFKLGDPSDRLAQPIFEKYDEFVGQDMVTFEVEITSLKRGRLQQQNEIRETLEAINGLMGAGRVGRVIEFEEIKGTCRAVIRCPGNIFQELVEGSEWQVRITWFDARPEFKPFVSIVSDFDVNTLGPIEAPDPDAPTICIVDSGVTPGNPFLEKVTKDELVRSFLDPTRFDAYDDVGHGSGVASLASYYALDINAGATNKGKAWIASARILDDRNECDERLFSKMIREAVEHFAPLGIKVFNLSANIKNQCWNEEAKRTIPRKSWVARAIDNLSREYDVVFVLSAGNLEHDTIDAYYQNGVDYPTYIGETTSSILDPAQAALGLSVGSIAPSTLAVTQRLTFELPVADANHPSPFTRCGPGIRREIKPEVLEFGGNLLRDENGYVYQNIGTNVVMATNRLTPPITTDCGTSYAAPRIAHKLASIQYDLEQSGVDDITAPLLKALLVNSASYDFLHPNLEEFLTNFDAEDSKHWLNVLGYGLPNDVLATFCSRSSALLFFQGLIEQDKVVFFDIPIPEEMADGESGAKVIKVTLSYAPEVQRWGLETYLGSVLKWRLFRGDVNREEIVAALAEEESAEFGNSEPRDAYLPNELKANLGINLRSRGTTQSDVFQWNRHQREFSQNHYTLAIESSEKWNRTTSAPVRYAVVVRVEDSTGTVDVYNRVQAALNAIEVQVPS